MSSELIVAGGARHRYLSSIGKDDGLALFQVDQSIDVATMAVVDGTLLHQAPLSTLDVLHILHAQFTKLESAQFQNRESGERAVASTSVWLQNNAMPLLSPNSVISEVISDREHCLKHGPASFTSIVTLTVLSCLCSSRNLKVIGTIVCCLLFLIRVASVSVRLYAKKSLVASTDSQSPFLGSMQLLNDLRHVAFVLQLCASRSPREAYITSKLANDFQQILKRCTNTICGPKSAVASHSNLQLPESIRAAADSFVLNVLRRSVVGPAFSLVSQVHKPFSLWRHCLFVAQLFAFTWFTFPSAAASLRLCRNELEELANEDEKKQSRLSFPEKQSASDMARICDTIRAKLFLFSHAKRIGDAEAESSLADEIDVLIRHLQECWGRRGFSLATEVEPKQQQQQEEFGKTEVLSNSGRGAVYDDHDDDDDEGDASAGGAFEFVAEGGEGEGLPDCKPSNFVRARRLAFPPLPSAVVKNMAGDEFVGSGTIIEKCGVKEQKTGDPRRAVLAEFQAVMRARK